MKNKLLISVLVLVLIGAGYVWYTKNTKRTVSTVPVTTTSTSRTPSPATSTPEAVNVPEEIQVKRVVSAFGLHLKNVPLTASTDILVPLLKKEYGPYVTTALLDRFVKDPTHAPGRPTSSPWPDRITVQRASKVGANYEVSGSIVWKTSTDIASGKEGVLSPVFLTLTKINGEWRISEYKTSLR
jgi:hypothetical protein